MIFWIALLVLLAILSGILGFASVVPAAVGLGQRLFAAVAFLFVLSIVLDAVRRSRSR